MVSGCGAERPAPRFAYASHACSLRDEIQNEGDAQVDTSRRIESEERLPLLTHESDIVAGAASDAKHDENSFFDSQVTKPVGSARRVYRLARRV
jgi:hypothetical protein